MGSVWRFICKSLILTLLFTSCSTFNSNKVKAQGNNVKIVKQRREDLPDEITRDGIKYKLKDVETGKIEELPEVKVKIERDLKVTYYLRWDEKASCFRGKQTHMWDKTVDPNGNIQKGYRIVKPGEADEVSLYSGASVEYSDPSIARGEDYLNKTHVQEIEGVKYNFHIGNSFEHNIEFKASNSDLCEQLRNKYDKDSELYPDVLHRMAFIERRPGEKPGINYTIFENYAQKMGIEVDKPMKKPKGDPGDWKSPTEFYSGQYGNQEFNYYTPPYSLRLPFVGIYEPVGKDGGDEDGGGGGNTDPVDPEIPSSGDIIFTPNSTRWTNKGKYGEGSGSYGVHVRYNGNSTVTLTGSVTSTEEVPHPYCDTNPDGTLDCDTYYTTEHHSATFDVTYRLERIEVSGDTSATLSGDSGDVSLTNEGSNLHLSAVGYWSEPSYNVPSLPGSMSSPSIPSPPSNPTGSSGRYQLDWTTPTLENLNSRGTGWTNAGKPSGYPVSFDILEPDPASGLKNTTWSFTDSSHYRNSQSGSLTNGSKGRQNVSIRLDEGIYNFHVNRGDIAGNRDTDDYGTYLIDYTPPEGIIDEIAHDRAKSSLTFGLDVTDNLEDANLITVDAPTSYNVNGRLDNQSYAHRNITYGSIPDEDTNYTFHYNLTDEAGNTRYYSFKTSVVREYWEQMLDTYRNDLDFEVPIIFLSNTDKNSMRGFKKSDTIDFDTFWDKPVEVMS